jgi:hypothetical protein
MTKYYGAHVNRINRDYEAVAKVTRDDERMRGDHPAWEQRVKPILAIVEQLGGLGTTSVIRTMARRQDISPLMTEECLFWLEKHGRVVRELGVWRAVRGG